MAIGALIDRQALAKIESHAVAKGRRIDAGANASREWHVELSVRSPAR
ncbi:hypothetical protein X771_29435 [Mesorhizobium sp. LSJC277A00]|nr:hypothetical protein X771_29435 [Mesorhizobium sp. LSJC277A00]ESX95784.1 hypothetical protein X753_32165 [Mesorhizobium sp. LNJC399B00]ESZ23654.1 hypothetical protein X734_25215 [Mesorhizobium sp. L2C084A000]